MVEVLVVFCTFDAEVAVDAVADTVFFVGGVGFGGESCERASSRASLRDILILPVTVEWRSFLLLAKKPKIEKKNQERTHSPAFVFLRLTIKSCCPNTTK